MGPSLGLHQHRTTQHEKGGYSLSMPQYGIRARDPIVRAIKDRVNFWSCDHCVRRNLDFKICNNNKQYYYSSNIIMINAFIVIIRFIVVLMTFVSPLLYRCRYSRGCYPLYGGIPFHSCIVPAHIQLLQYLLVTVTLWETFRRMLFTTGQCSFFPALLISRQAVCVCNIEYQENMNLHHKPLKYFDI